MHLQMISKDVRIPRMRPTSVRGGHTAISYIQLPLGPRPSSKFSTGAAATASRLTPVASHPQFFPPFRETEVDIHPKPICVMNLMLEYPFVCSLFQNPACSSSNVTRVQIETFITMQGGDE